MPTVADLKALTWIGGAHADGSDKGGRFSIDFASADFNGERIDASKKRWRSGGGESTYMFRGTTFQRWRCSPTSSPRRSTSGMTRRHATTKVRSIAERHGGKPHSS
jgi:hypothetical protein